VARLMLPGIFGSSVQQFSLLLDTWIASFLATGSISWMYYADRMVEFPMGVFSIALATVILPGLSAHHAEQSPERFNTTLDWALRLTILVSLPAAVALFLLSGPLVATIFAHGRFTPHDGVMSSYALMAYSLGLLGFSLVKVLAPGYFARLDTRTPVKVGIIALCVNVAFNIFVVIPANLAHFPAPHALLALSTGLGAYVNTWLLYRGLRRSGVYRPAAPRWRRLALQAVLANIAMGAVLIWTAGDWNAWYQWSWSVKCLHLAVCVAAGAVVYGAALWLAGVRYPDLRPDPVPSA
jgi:putative peptidoglycan lipid II flippase